MINLPLQFLRRGRAVPDFGEGGGEVFDLAGRDDDILARCGLAFVEGRINPKQRAAQQQEMNEWFAKELFHGVYQMGEV